MFRALFLDKDNGFTATANPVDTVGLPVGDVTVAVEYSTLNYKDGLAITNKGPVVCQWPMVTGIDGAGKVLESSSPQWKPIESARPDGWQGTWPTGRADLM